MSLKNQLAALLRPTETDSQAGWEINYELLTQIAPVTQTMNGHYDPCEIAQIVLKTLLEVMPEEGKQFNPDWDLKEAHRRSLAEHTETLRQLQDENERLKGNLSDMAELSDKSEAFFKKERSIYYDEKEYLSKENAKLRAEISILQTATKKALAQEPFGYFLPDQGGNVFTKNKEDKATAERFNWPVITLYSDPVIAPCNPPIPAEHGDLTPRWVPIESPEDMPDGADYVLWDGCDLRIDFIDTEAEFGTTFFSNGTEATHYLAGLKTPQFEVKPSEEKQYPCYCGKVMAKKLNHCCSDPYCIPY